VSARLHEVTFRRLDDAVAFVAAVSRQCAAPRFDVILGDRPVRAEVALLADRTCVYLSDGALIVAQRAFGPVPHVPMEPTELPVETGDVIAIDLADPAGFDDVMSRVARDGGEELRA
jgi:hypothetical protein